MNSEVICLEIVICSKCQCDHRDCPKCSNTHAGARPGLVWDSVPIASPLCETEKIAAQGTFLLYMKNFTLADKMDIVK